MTAERDWRAIANEQGDRLLYMLVALHVLRAWGNVTDPRSPGVASAIHRWIDTGMQGPVPWPDDPGFGPWAARNGLRRVGDHIGPWFTTPPGSTTVH